MRPIHWLVLCALAAMTLVLGAVVVGAFSLIWT
jgi:hypothetical protein